MKKVAFNQGLIVDVALASLIVQKGPELLNRFVFSGSPLTGMTATLAGVGVGYLAGSFMGKNNLANAAIALGAVEVVSPLIDDLVGGVSMPKELVGGVAPKPAYLPAAQSIADYYSLNDYVMVPSPRQYDDYRSAY